MGLGTTIDHAMTSEEAMKLAGLDWSVAKYPSAAVIDLGPDIPAMTLLNERGYQVVRLDTMTPLGQVGPQYQEVQQHELFSIGDDILRGLGHEARYSAAWEQDGGRRVALLIELPDDVSVGGDPMVASLAIVNSHDGSQAVGIAPVFTRVRCTNIVSGIMRRRSTYRLRHTAGVKERAKQAGEVLGLTSATIVAFREEVEALQTAWFTIRQAELIIADTYRVREQGITTAARTRRQNRADAAQAIYWSDTIAGFVGTGWGIVQAVNEESQWARPVRPEAMGRLAMGAADTVTEQARRLVLA